MAILVTKFRKKLGLSKYAFAKQVGVSWVTVNNWEHGFFTPSEESVKKMEILADKKGMKIK